ncbi:metallophosphoesterase [Glaciecola sp. 2405UD65-10]|uniref:metallophosphoesterase n=1 Tax=Glaciecola sp. 2405UD65-10 TaxID=3397244 RepID=UPI003B59C7CF
MRIIKLVSIFIIIFSILIGIWISRATVELTQGGVYTNILLPLGSQSIKINALRAVHAESPSLQSMQGPVVTYENDKMKLHWHCLNETFLKFYDIDTTSVSFDCLKRTHHFSIYPTPQYSEANYEQATGEIAVIGDLEGNIAFFKDWAQANGIIDTEDNWTFSDNHLVIIGDIVDRGRYVHDLLWYIYELEQKAKAKGGHVHVVIGNHEQYILTGVLSRVEAEHLYATELLMPYTQAFARQSVIGAWLRSKPIIIKLGDTLFVHGGIAKHVVADEWNIDMINEAHWKSLSTDIPSTEHKQVLYQSDSLTRYRGFADANNHKSKEYESAIADTLEHFNVKQIVVGHTFVPEIKGVFDNRVWLTEVDDAKLQSLIIKNNIPYIVTTPSLKENYIDKGKQLRKFNLFNYDDWYALFGGGDFVKTQSEVYEKYFE